MAKLRQKIPGAGRRRNMNGTRSKDNDCCCDDPPLLPCRDFRCPNGAPSQVLLTLPGFTFYEEVVEGGYWVKGDAYFEFAGGSFVAESYRPGGAPTSACDFWAGPLAIWTEGASPNWSNRTCSTVYPGIELYASVTLGDSYYDEFGSLHSIRRDVVYSTYYPPDILSGYFEPPPWQDSYNLLQGGSINSTHGDDCYNDSGSTEYVGKVEGYICCNGKMCLVETDSGTISYEAL